MVQTIRVLIVDDEQPARGTIRLILNQIPHVEIMGECVNGEECLQYIRQKPNIDIIFLDIEMPGSNGLQVASSIRWIAPDTEIVFSTGYGQFAVEAFDLEAFDYILKPYKKNRIMQTISRFQTKHGMDSSKKQENMSVSQQNQKLIIHTKEKIKLLNPHTEIAFISNEKAGGTRFFTTEGIIESKTSLKEFENIVLEMSFIRTHRCYLVNLDFIQEIVPWANDTYMLVMKGYEKYKVPVSRTYLKSFKQTLGM